MSLNVSSIRGALKSSPGLEQSHSHFASKTQLQQNGVTMAPWFLRFNGVAGLDSYRKKQAGGYWNMLNIRVHRLLGTG
jgi:hypothetical protein